MSNVELVKVVWFFGRRDKESFTKYETKASQEKVTELWLIPDLQRVEVYLKHTHTHVSRRIDIPCVEVETMVLQTGGFLWKTKFFTCLEEM